MLADMKAKKESKIREEEEKKMEVDRSSNATTDTDALIIEEALAEDSKVHWVTEQADNPLENGLKVVL